MNHALPIVLPRIANEALGSWVERTALLYGISGHDLLSNWDLQARSDRSFAESTNSRALRLDKAVLAHHMRSPEESLYLGGDATREWLVWPSVDCAVCPRCLLEDDHNGRPRFRRSDWDVSWRTRCLEHGLPLVQMRDWSANNLTGWQVPERTCRYANGRLRATGQTQVRRTTRQKPVIAAAAARVWDIEQCIARAIGGRRPH